MTPQRKRLLGLGLLLFAISFGVYFATSAPGLTWAHRGLDGGDLLAAAATLGVPHPAGYPSYTMLLSLFLALPWNEPARAGNLMSVAAGSAAVVFCGLSVHQILNFLAVEEERKGRIF